MRSIFSIILFLPYLNLLAQGVSEEYTRLVRKADSLYEAHDYKSSATIYSEAFKSLGWKGALNDRYNAACSWALAKVPDSAFYNLDRIINVGGYNNYHHISTDSDLSSLTHDSRWKPLMEKVKANKVKAEANLNKPLVRLLDSIYNEDQDLRLQLDPLEKKHGWNSTQVQDHWKKIRVKDSLNLIKIRDILDRFGWLGPDVVGEQGSSTLFLVIQHSDQQTQEKYLPMMREAVLVGKASPSSLALLEDRVALGQGKRQKYGSQITKDPRTDKFVVMPLEDVDHVDDMRRKAGLSSLAEYVKHWDIQWDPALYKKDVDALEAAIKKQEGR